MPVQPESTASSARYSSASRPTAEALTRIGRSLLTTVTSTPSLREVLGDGQDAGVVVAEPEAGGQRERVGVVELDAQGAAVVADRHRGVEPALADPQVVEQPQGLAGEVAELRVVPLGLELGDDDDRQHDLVLLEPQHRARVGQQDGGVEHERLGRRGRGRPGGVARRACGRLQRVSWSTYDGSWRGHVSPWRSARSGACAYSRTRCRDQAPTSGGAGSGPPPGAGSAPSGGLPERGTGAPRQYGRYDRRSARGVRVTRCPRRVGRRARRATGSPARGGAGSGTGVPRRAAQPPKRRSRSA